MASAVEAWRTFCAEPHTGFNATEFLGPIGAEVLAGSGEDVRQALLSPVTPAADGLGADWLHPIRWPDTHPRLKTWAGRQSLASLIRARQDALRGAPGDPLDAVVAMKGASGWDSWSAPTALEAGFSPDAHPDMLVAMRPGLELLAIVALGSLPVISFGRRDWRDVGVIYRNAVWRWTVEPRGGYYCRWGDVRREALQ